MIQMLFREILLIAIYYTLEVILSITQISQIDDIDYTLKIGAGLVKNLST